MSVHPEATSSRTDERLAFRGRVEGEPDWLYQLREQAWQTYQEQPLPDRVRHLWRYTDPRVFVPADPKAPWASKAANVSRAGDLSRPEGVSAAALASAGDVRIDLSDDTKWAGVVLMDLEAAAAHPEHGPRVREHLGALIGVDMDKFETLNLAAFRTGLALILPRNASLAGPIHLRRLVGEGSLFPTRLLVIAGENSEASVIDEYTGQPGAGGQINSAVEVIADSAARLKLVTVANLPNTQTLYLTQRNKIGRDVDLQSVGVNVNAGLAKINWATELAGRGASSRWAGLLLGSGEQHIDAHTRHRHAAGETFSDLVYKVALRDRAMSAYTGLIAIDEHAANCEAYQENRNLLLSEDAHVESIPELEIVNDDVKCSHGVTVGPLEEEQLFYFESRGIHRDEALRIILAGYFETILQRLPGGYDETGRGLLMNKLMGEMN